MSPDSPRTRSRSDRRALVRRYVDSSLITKARIYLLVFLIVMIMAVADTARGTAWTWLFLLGGLAAGALVGGVVSRMQRLDWDEFESRVVGRFDAVGVVILVLYIVFAIFRSKIVSAWVPAEHAAAASMGVLAGVMLGQVLGIRRGVVLLGRRLTGNAPR